MKTQYRANAVELRERQSEEEMRIEGYFVVFDDVTELWDGVYEKIDRHAFDNELNKDIRALFNHDTAKVLGRTKNNTLELIPDEKGLRGVITLNKDDPEAVSLYHKVKRGDVDQCSFGFIPIKEEHENMRDGGTLFTIKECELIEVSVVTFPAYENTSISARKREFERNNVENFKKEMRGKLYGTKSTTKEEKS